MTEKEFINELEYIGFERTSQNVPVCKWTYGIYDIRIFQEKAVTTFPMYNNIGRYTYSNEYDKTLEEIFKNNWYDKNRVRDKKIEEILKTTT